MQRSPEQGAEGLNGCLINEGQDCPLECQGVNDLEKRKVVKALLRMQRVNLVCL